MTHHTTLLSKLVLFPVLAASLHAATITTHPASQTVAQGTGASMAVTATGSGTLTYLWQKDGVDIPGATSSTFSLASAKPWHIGDYTVKVTDANGSITSNPAALSLTGINSGIWRGLIGFYELDGSGVDLSPIARDGANFGSTAAADRFGVAGRASSFNGASYISVPSSPIIGRNAFSISFWASVEVQPNGSEGWQVVFGQPAPNQGFHVGNRGYGATNMYGGFWSNTTAGNTPFVSLSYNQYFQFVATFDGTRVSIFKNGGLVGSSTQDLSGVNLQPGSLQFGKQLGINEYFKGLLDSVRIYNRALSANEVQALYASEATVQLAAQPQSLTVAQNTEASFSVTATGAGPLAYQWQKDGVDIPGATSSTFSLASAKPWHIGDYTVKVTDANGTITSNAATLSLTGINSGIWRGMVNYWPFSNSTNDLGFTANHFFSTNAVTSPNRFNKAAESYYFDGAAWMISAANSTITGSAARTVSFWMKHEDMSWYLGYPNLVAWGDVSNSGASFAIRAYPITRLLFVHGATPNKMFGPDNWMQSSLWYHVVVAVPSAGTASDTKAYINGQEIVMSPTNYSDGTFATALTKFRIGTESDTGGVSNDTVQWRFQALRGWMDDIRVYNRALSAPEVTALYSAENASNNWRQTHFGSTANSGNAADDADPDGDGLKNLLEYALNLPPNAASRVPASVQATGVNLEYTYTRGTAAFNGGTSFQVEWSDNLSAWSSAGVVETLLSDDGTYQQVKATLPSGSGGRRFVRLRVQ